MLVELYTSDKNPSRDWDTHFLLMHNHLKEVDAPLPSRLAFKKATEQITAMVDYGQAGGLQPASGVQFYIQYEVRNIAHFVYHLVYFFAVDENDNLVTPAFYLRTGSNKTISGYHFEKLAY